jgi:hypothetical protein
MDRARGVIWRQGGLPLHLTAEDPLFDNCDVLAAAEEPHQALAVSLSGPLLN